MIVSVSSLTGTHPLDLARQMAERGLLGKYYTTLPHTRTPRVPPDRTRRHLALTPLIALGMKQWLPGTEQDFYWYTNKAFDQWLARRLEPCDVIQCLVGCGLETLRTARSRAGAAGVCDSGNSHVRYQHSIMREEWRKWGLTDEPTQQRLMDRIEEEYAAADLITVPSTFAKRTFIEHGVDERRIALTPYGVDQSDFHPVAKTDDTFRILFVGTLCLRKGLPYLLDSVSRLKLARAELVLRGGERPSTAIILRQYKGSIPLRLVEAQPKARMKELFSQASVMVLPSIEDGFGLVIAQAMACGVPVIASTHTGGPDLITDGVEGFLIQPRDSKVLAERLLELYENRSLLSRMSQAALSRVQSMRGWGAYGDCVERAYRKIVGGSYRPAEALPS